MFVIYLTTKLASLTRDRFLSPKTILPLLALQLSTYVECHIMICALRRWILKRSVRRLCHIYKILARRFFDPPTHRATQLTIQQLSLVVKCTTSTQIVLACSSCCLLFVFHTCAIIILTMSQYIIAHLCMCASLIIILQSVSA